MSAAAPRVERVNCFKPEGHLYGYQFRCPGCGHEHLLPVGDGSGHDHPRWSFNGDMAKPTFSPSILAKGSQQTFDAAGEWTGEWVKDDAGNPLPFVCHSFVNDGQIQFLSDCTHKLAGTTVDLPEFRPGDQA